MNQYEVNRNNLFKLLDENSMVLLSSGQLKHKSADQFYHFQVDKTFYYLTGIRQENCVLMMLKDGKDLTTYLFIQETTAFMKRWLGEKISKEEASLCSGISINSIHYNASFDSIIGKLMTVSRRNISSIPDNLFLDLYRPSDKEDPVSYKQFKFIIEQYKELKIKNLNTHTHYLRMFKSEEEIQKIREAIAITNHGLNRIMKELKNRSNEHLIEADFNHEITLQGADGVGFDTILASGKNGCVLHYEDNNSPLNEEELLLCDLGALKDEYSADISRTYPINGVYSTRQKQIYEVVLNCNKKCIEYIKEGITLNDLHSYSKQLLTEGCKRIGLIKKDKDIDKYYYHSVTHLLGLDVHDVGTSKIALKAGMVLTVEPGLYIADEGIGIRIEDDVLVTKKGPVNLSKAIIKEIKDIETFMK